MLAHRTLAKIVIRSMALSPTMMDQMEEILFNMGRKLILSDDMKETVKDVQQEFKAKYQLLAEHGLLPRSGLCTLKW